MQETHSCELISAFLPQLMRLLAQKLSHQTEIKHFFHTLLLVSHLKDARELFNPKITLHTVLKEYYQRFLKGPDTILEEKLDFQHSEELQFLKELYKLQEKETLLFEVVLMLLLEALETQYSPQVQAPLSRKIIQKCQDLQFILTMEDLCISEILLKFLTVILDQLESLMFLEMLSNLFHELAFERMIRFLDTRIKSHRQQFNLMAQAKRTNNDKHLKKKERRSSLLVSKRHNQPFNKESNENRKVSQQFMQETKFEQKTVKRTAQTTQKAQNRRTSTFFSKKFQFTSRKTEPNFFANEETTYQEERVDKNRRMEIQIENKMYSSVHSNNWGLNNEELDSDHQILAEGTPPKKFK